MDTEDFSTPSPKRVKLESPTQPNPSYSVDPASPPPPFASSKQEKEGIGSTGNNNVEKEPPQLMIPGLDTFNTRTERTQQEATKHDAIQVEHAVNSKIEFTESKTSQEDHASQADPLIVPNDSVGPNETLDEEVDAQPPDAPAKEVQACESVARMDFEQHLIVSALEDEAGEESVQRDVNGSHDPGPLDPAGDFEPSSIDLHMVNGSVEEPAVEEPPVGKLPVEELPGEEGAVEEGAAEQAPVEDVTVEEALVEEALAERPPGEEAPVGEALVEMTPGEKASVEVAPDEEASAELQSNSDILAKLGPSLRSQPNGLVESLGSALVQPRTEKLIDMDAEFEEDSSPYSSSDSESDASDDSISSTKTLEGEYQTMDLEEQARALMAEDGNPVQQGKIVKAVVRTMNEKPDEPSHIPDVKITDTTKVEELGQVASIVDVDVVIKAKTSGEYRVLDYGSLLCLEDRKLVGVIAETLGKVQQPFYTMRFPNAEALAEAGLFQGTKIFYVPEHSTYIFTKPLEAIKGTDASNLHDEEVGDDEIEFSDDEAEAEYRRKKKAELRAKREDRFGDLDGYSRGPGGRRGRQFRVKAEESPARSRVYRVPPVPSDEAPADFALNYDDGPSSELYTPLARPTSLSGMPNGQEPLMDRGMHGRARGYMGGGRGRGGRNHYNHPSRGGMSFHGHGNESHQNSGFVQPPMPYNAAHSPSPIEEEHYRAMSIEQRSFTNGFQPMHQAQHHQQPPYQDPGQFPWPQMMQEPAFPNFAQPQMFPPLPHAPAPAGGPPFIPAGSHVNPAFFRPSSQGQDQPQWPQQHQQRHYQG